MNSPSLDLVLLCAGKGDRLKPLTDLCPKPLLPVVGVTMADRALAACEALPVGRKIANAHHLPEQILAWAEARYLDHVQIEPVLLDTGAALARLKYEDEILSGHVLVHNGDLIHGIDLPTAWEAHLKSRASATLVVVDRPRINTVVVQEGRFGGVLGHPKGPESLPEGATARTFSGIAFYRSEAIAGDPSRPWSIKELWHDLLQAGKTIAIWEAPTDALWDDLGTAADLGRAVGEELARRGLDSWIDPHAHVHPFARVGAGCVVEFGADLAESAVLERSVLFPGATTEIGEHLDSVLRNPGGDLPWR